MELSEQDQAQLSYEMAVYREQIALIKRETERISLTTIDLSNALSTVEKVKLEEGNKPMLVPIGGGAMIKGVMSEAKILVPIGAQYLVEMSREEAIAELKKRVEATKKAVERLSEEFSKISEKLQQATAQLREIQAQEKISDRVDENIREDYI